MNEPGDLRCSDRRRNRSARRWRSPAIALFLVALLNLVPSHATAQGYDPREPWNGSISYRIDYGDKGASQEGEYSNEWDFQRTLDLTITVTDGVGHAVVRDALSNWQKNTSPFSEGVESIMIFTTSETGQGEGEVDVWVEFDDEKKTYWLKTNGPDYEVLRTGRTWSSVAEIAGVPQPAEQTTGVAYGIPIDAPDQAVGANPDVLTGQLQYSQPVTGSGQNLTTITWALFKGPLDLELIVTPEKYDDWLPEPGTDEATPGPKPLNVGLEVRDRNGGPPALHAIRFNTRLVDTSKERGIALNAPLNTPGNPLPDLRFLEQDGAVVAADGQSIESGSEDGVSGTVMVGAFDGGGWATLMAEATLEGGIRLEGHLLVPGGVIEIPLPKRAAGSKIGTAWLNANGNPGEQQDDEKSTGNGNRGDGLSAYEEYRGFIARKNFTRLDPRAKELGVKVKEQELPVFEDGLSLFEAASSVRAVRFFENEIPANRRLNANAGHARVYEQYALQLEDGRLSSGVAGENRPITVTAKLPKQSERVVIDLQGIGQAYQAQQAAFSAASIAMPYTLGESIASTVAHELAHGVNVNHHGPPSSVPEGRTAFPNSQPPYHIVGIDGVPMTLPPQGYTIPPRTGSPGNDASGDLMCIMAYSSAYQWAFHVGADGSLNYYAVPPLPVGNRFCPSPRGTGINGGPNYFGDAAQGSGNCLSRIKLRN